MDGLSQAVRMWQIEAGLSVAFLIGVYFYHRGIKLWMAREGVSLVFILGVTLAIVTVIFLCLRDRIHWFGNRYALFFVLLYCWSALGFLFIASRKTGSFKMLLGLSLQAAIVYRLYLLV